MNKPPVHVYVPFLWAGDAVALCGKQVTALSRPTMDPDPANTTCKRCQRMLADRVEHELARANVPIHYLANASSPLPYACHFPRGKGDAWSTGVSRVTCQSCLAVLHKDLKPFPVGP